MAILTLRQTPYQGADTGTTVSNSPLTNEQIDTNFINLDVDIKTRATKESPTFTGTVTIPGGTINATSIGQTTAAPGTFSTLASGTVNLTGGTISGVSIDSSTIGATTPANGSFNNIVVAGGTLSTINNTSIGQTTAAPGTFSTLASGSINLTGGAIAGVSINNSPIGASTANSGVFTTLSASDAVTFNPAGKKVEIKPTGTGGIVEIAPAGAAGSIDRMNIGATTAGTGKFTTLQATDAVTFSPVDKNVLLKPGGSGKVEIYPNTIGSIDRMTIGGTTAAAGTFTQITVNGAAGTTISPTGTLGTVTINPAAIGTINNMTIGNSTAAAGTFTNLSSTGTVAFTNALPIGSGGTGTSTAPTQGGVIYANGTTSFASSAAGTAGDILKSNGTAAPTWITTLPVANGGTNSSAAPTAGGIAYGNGTAYAFTGAGTAGYVLKSNGASAPTWEDLIIQIVDETENATRYVTFTDQTQSVENRLNITSSKFTVNPSTGVFNAPFFVGDGRGYNGGQGILGIESYQLVTDTTYTALSFQHILADTTNNPITITLPATPAERTVVKVFDYAEKFNINAVTILRNGSTIEEQAEDLVLNRVSTETTFLYLGGTWRVFVNYRERSKVIGPILIGPTAAYEYDTIQINIKNYQTTGVYNVTTSGGTTVQNGSVILWTLPTVTSSSEDLTLTVSHIVGVSGISTTTDFIVSVNNIETAVDASITITDFTSPNSNLNWIAG